MPRATRALVMMVATLTLVATACGDDDGAGGADGASLSVQEVWSRPSSGNNGAVYMTLIGGDTEMALVGASVAPDVASVAEIHETTMDDSGAMTMSMTPQVVVPAGSSVLFEPGGHHVMLMGLTEPLVAGDTFDVMLRFADGSEKTVQAEVRDE